MDTQCSICDKEINIIATHHRHEEFKGGIACMECVYIAQQKTLKKELKRMLKRKKKNG